MNPKSKFKHLKIAVAAVAVPIILSACASHSGNHHKNDVMNSSACAGNVFLQKYGCSVSRVERAARAGNPDAQYALGYMYYYGIGTVRDPQIARQWIDKSAAQGQPLARKASRLLASGGDLNYATHAPGGVRRGGGGGPSRHQPRADVNQLNAQTPTGPISDHMPAYGKKTRRTSPVMDSYGSKSKAPTLKPAGKPSTPPPASEPTSQLRKSMPSWTAWEQQLMRAPGNTYTLQLMGSHNLAAVKAFVRRNRLEGKTKYYTAQYDGQKWYMLVYGQYANIAKADAAVRTLPRGAKALHPWVKPLTIVHKEIRTREIVS